MLIVIIIIVGVLVWSWVRFWFSPSDTWGSGVQVLWSCNGITSNFAICAAAMTTQQSYNRGRWNVDDYQPS